MTKGKRIEKAFILEEKLEQILVPIEEQPYPIPDNWCWIRLGDVVQILNGYAFKSQKYVDKGIRIIRIANVQDGYIEDDKPVFYPSEAENEIQKYMLEADDLLISLTGNVGRVAFLKSDMLPAALNQRVGCLRLNNSFYNKALLFYYFQRQEFQDDCIRNAKGSAQLNMSTEWLKIQPVSIPPFFEQQRIVDRISYIFTKLDKVKEKAQAVVDGFEMRKSAILHKAFCGDLTGQWRKAHNINLDNWENVTLNDIAEYKKGPFGSSITKAMFVQKAENTYKVYEQGNAIRKTLDYGHYYITEEKYDELKNFAVKPGDIIVSCAGTIGEVYRLPEGCEAGIINQALMRVRLFPEITEKYFIYYFGEVLKSDVNDKANGTAIKNIPPFKIMKAMPVRLPPVMEQEAMIVILDDILSKEEAAKDIAETVVDQIGIIKKSILSRAFRGELGTNDPNDESAIELLKQRGK